MVAELEKFDTDLIRLQEMYDYEKRKELLIKKFNILSKRADCVEDLE